MQNLRDKLLKAGLVTEKQANEAERTQKAPKKHREREERSEFRILDMQACCPEIALGLYETVR